MYPPTQDRHLLRKLPRHIANTRTDTPQDCSVERVRRARDLASDPGLTLNQPALQSAAASSRRGGQASVARMDTLGEQVAAFALPAEIRQAEYFIALIDSYLEEREKKEGLTCGVTVTVMFTTGRSSTVERAFARLRSGFDSP
jgi:hypothetical protein